MNGMAMSASSAERRRYHDRASVTTAAIMQIFETAPTSEREEAIEEYLRDEFLDEQRQALTDYAQYWGSGNV
jgi:hypothetical protein